MISSKTIAVEWLSIPSLHESELKHLTQEMRCPQTLQLIFETLGEFSEGVAPRSFPADRLDSAMPATAYLPFRLSDKGIEFFCDLLDGLTVDPNAYVVGWEGPSFSPLGLWVKLPAENDAVVLNLASLAGDALPKGSSYRFMHMIADFLFVYVFQAHEILIKPVAPHTPRDLYQRAVWKDPWGDEGLHLLTMTREDVFHGSIPIVFPPNDTYSGDFRHVVWADRKNMKNRHVGEIGGGSGALALQMLHGGAQSVVASELSLAHALLARWNDRYARETGQISASAYSARFQIQTANGFPQADADIYVFNAPSIRAPRFMTGDVPSRFNGIIRHSNFMDEGIYVDLFQQLVEKLRHPESYAIWRVMPISPPDEPLSYFTLNGNGGTSKWGWMRKWWDAASHQHHLAESFLATWGNANLRWKLLSHPDNGIFRLWRESNGKRYFPILSK